MSSSASSEFAIREATLADAETIVGHRRAMFHDMGYRDMAWLDQMASSFLPWLRRKLKSAEYLAWFAVTPDGAVAAGAGLWLMDWPPHMVNGSTRRGNILNVYTDPAYRRQGLARGLTDVAIDWCRTHDIAVVILHASDEGRPLYESLGFHATNEMRLDLT